MSTQTNDTSDAQVLAYGRTAARVPRYLVKALAYSRPLAYASEVGESMRKVIPKLVTPLYALSIGYVFVDIAIKYLNIGDRSTNYKKYFLLDLSLWHLGASILFPAITINRFVHGSTYLLNKAKVGNKVAVFGPAIAAVCLIPFIVHPLDHATDWLMDNSFRKYIDYKSYENENVLPGTIQQGLPESKKHH
jgi:hypothetical protein